MKHGKNYENAAKKIESGKLYEVNDALSFDRNASWGKRLDIPSGTAVRFEPGDKKEVNLVDIGGYRRVYGIRNMCDGFLDGMSKGSGEK